MQVQHRLIHIMPLSLELLQCVLAKLSMQYRSPIILKSNHRSIPHSPRIAHASTHLDVTIALLESLSAKVAWRKDIDRPSVIPARTTNSLLQWTTNQKVHMVSMEGRGRRLTLYESPTQEPLCDEIGSHQNELCCLGHPRHFLAAWPHSSTTHTHENSSNQVYRGPHPKVTR